MIELTQSTDKKKPLLFKSIFFWIGYIPVFALYFAVYSYPSIYSFITRQPAPYTLDVSVFGLMYDFRQLGLLPWVPLVFNLMPYLIGWGYIQGTDVLICTLIGFVAAWVAYPVIMNALGMIASFPKGWHTWYAEWTLKDNYYLAAVDAGLLIGLALLPLILNREYVANILKSITGKVSKDFDPESPINYRHLLIAVIVCFFAFIASMAAMNTPVIPAIVFVVFLCLVFMGAARLMASTGGLMGNHYLIYHHSSHIALYGTIIAVIIGGISLKEMVLEHMTTWWLYCWNVYIWAVVWGAAAWFGLNAFKIGKDMKVSTREMFKAICYAFIVATIAGALSYIIFLHVVPISARTWDKGLWVEGYYYSFGSSCLQTGMGGYFFGRHAIDSTLRNNTLISTVIGIALVFVLGALSAKVPIINVAGIALGIIMGEQLWIPFIIALIAKLLTIAVGGAEVYQKKGVPLAIGMILAYATVVVIESFPIGMLSQLRSWAEAGSV